MLINNEPVKQSIHTQEKDNDIITIETFRYFACTCKEKDEKFYESIINIFFPEANNGFYKRKRSTYFIRELNKLDWQFNSVGADMWMGTYFHKRNMKNDNFEQHMDIECDVLEYGLVTALIIAKNLQKADS